MKTRTLSLLALLGAFLAVPAGAQTIIEGPYVGLLPCKNCPGIRTELALERDAKTGAPRRYWLRENFLDARSGHRKHEFIAKSTQPESEGEEQNEAPGTTLAPTLEADQKPDGSGSIEATLDARSVESIGPWQLQGKRIVIQTANGPRQFERVSERVIEALVGAKGQHGAKPDARHMQLRAAGTTGFSGSEGASFAGIVTRDPTGRLVLNLCGERGALILEDGARLPSVDVVLDNLGFTRVGSAYLELFGVQQGLHLKAKRVARASTDLNCSTAQPAPMSLAINGGETGWSLHADVDGIRLKLPTADGQIAQRGSTAQPLIWTWHNGRRNTAAALLHSGNITVHASPRLCRDTMSNTVYGFAAELSYAGKRLNGCAWSAASDQP